MHFASHDIRVFRDPYVSSTGESLIATIAKKKSLQKNTLDIFRTITEE